MRTPLIAVALLVASTAGAQSSTGAPQSRVPTAADSAVARALDLPSVMQRARDAGIPDSTLRGVMDQIRRRGIPAGDAIPAVELEVETVEQGGDKNNFGSFVRAQVEGGLRGQELAAAIRAERERRGMGPGHRGHGGDSAAARGGRPEGAGVRPEGAGVRPETRGGRPGAAAGRRPVSDSADKAPTRGKRP